MGPVSAYLEEDIRAWVRRHGIVVWLDVDHHYTDFVDHLARQRAEDSLPYAVHGFRGSHLALMLELESVAGGAERTPLLVHLPGFTEDTVRSTPILELYEAGVRYRKKLDTLVTEAAAGRVRPERISAFREAGNITLATADAWLSSQLDDQAGGGLGAQLLAMRLTAVVDDLLTAGFVATRLADPDALDVVWDHLGARTGLDATWRDAMLPKGQPRPGDVAFAVASWALAVEYVHDLKRPPVSTRLAAMVNLPGPVVELCRELALHLRTAHGTFYQRTADETEGGLTDESGAARAEDLGRIDTFRFEEDLVLTAALSALEDERWAAAADWAHARLDGDTSGGSFWLREDPARRACWQLVRDAAQLGDALTRAGTQLEATSLEHAVERYMTAGATVDQAHRHLEQRRTALLYPQLPKFEALRARLDGLRVVWRSWADQWARDFNKLCRSEGFVGSATLQQRTLFDEVVRPLTQEPGTTALFVVDALRFEMAEELFRAIDGTAATTVHLRGRLAELPTVTEVGMNVLAPVSRAGRLAPSMSGGAFKGFSTGEFLVSDPESRTKAMASRAGGATCPYLKLANVLSRDGASLKKSIQRANLVIVHSVEIDSAGEQGVGTAVFDTILQKLRAAWRLLRDAGVRRFVFTADHGFLLLDETVRDVVAHGRKVDPKRRHVVSTVGADHPGEVRVPLSDLGYDDTAGLHVMFPESTAVFDTGDRSMAFVHGGNSLQERVIPVLTVVHRSAVGGDMSSYTVWAEAREAVANMHCVAVRLETPQGALGFSGPREVELALSVVDEGQVAVELCQVRGGARLVGGGVQATVGQDFELFFKLTGRQEARVRVQIVHPTATADVTPKVVETRFAVIATRTVAPEAAPAVASADWLDAFEPGVRQLFAHLAAHGTITEPEAMGMLGGPRGLRRFSAQFEEHVARAPFAVRIDTAGGVKRYVRDGNQR